MLLVAVFSARQEGTEELSPDSIVASPPLLIANTLDGKLWHGQWEVIGNVKPDTRVIPLPKYKVKVREQMCVEDFTGELRRPAKSEELPKLSFRTCVTPVVVEGALKAAWGFGAWLERYDKLKAEKALEAASVRL